MPPEYFPHLFLLRILHLAPVFQQPKYLTALTLTTLFYLPYLPSFVSTNRGEEWTCSDLGSKLGEVLATHWCLTPLDFVYLKHLSFDFDANCSYEKPYSKLSAVNTQTSPSQALQLSPATYMTMVRSIG